MVSKLRANEVLAYLGNKQKHLPGQHREELQIVITDHVGLFPEAPGTTNAMVDMGNAMPVNQHPYRINLHKSAMLKEEIITMLQHTANTKTSCIPVSGQWTKKTTLFVRFLIIDFPSKNVFTWHRNLLCENDAIELPPFLD